MYIVILMVAMTTPADQPAWGWRHGCHGCTGSSCHGSTGTRAGCTGSALPVHSCVGSAPVMAAPAPIAAPAPAPAMGYSCGGCGGCHGKLFGKKGGGCWSTNGYKTSYGCHGAGSCFGHAYAGVSYGFAGCYGSCYGSMTNYFSYWAYPTGGAVYAAPTGPMMPPPVPPVGIPGTRPATPPATTPRNDFDAAPASVIVALPADAKLFANGQITRLTGANRQFATPELIPGLAYSYIFTAEITRNNEPITETIEVEVMAGVESRVTFAKLMAAIPAESTGIASK